MRKKHWAQPQVEPLPLLSSKPDGNGNRIQQVQTSYFENLKISCIAEQALMDSGASNTMFVLREVFTDYKLVTPQNGDSARAENGGFKIFREGNIVDYKPVTPRNGDLEKAENGGFEIVREGNIVQHYQIDGKEWEITYTCALHTPTLNMNLVSVSAMDKAGLTTTFADGKGVIKKTDGTVILTSWNVNRMYLLKTLEELPKPTVAITSLSQPVSLKQWHWCLMHCNPVMIQEIARKGLVDGLVISEMTVNRKCEDCIMGHQTQWPFNRITEKDLALLELVAFDLWGPFCVQSFGGKTYMMIVVDGRTSFKHRVYLPEKSQYQHLMSSVGKPRLLLGGKYIV